MPRVIRDLPNGSDEISGVKFFPLEDGRLISDEIDDETAESFCSVPGYSLDVEDAAPVKQPAAEPAPTLTKAQQKAAEKAAKEAAGKAASDKAPAAPAVEGDGAPVTDPAGPEGNDSTVF